jgi:hypothetical protein
VVSISTTRETPIAFGLPGQLTAAGAGVAAGAGAGAVFCANMIGALFSAAGSAGVDAWTGADDAWIGADGVIGAGGVDADGVGASAGCTATEDWPVVLGAAGDGVTAAGTGVNAAGAGVNAGVIAAGAAAGMFGR